jgi:dTDP-4-dehydrorhamnose 3,5-epimerase
MRFESIPLAGACLIHPDKRGDERGFFARFFCQRELREAGLMTEIAQINNSLSAERGTLRGMHYQLAPAAETKIVRCIRGALFDVILDLRPRSPTFKQWFGTTLSAENRSLLYVPKGLAHGFLTLEPNTEVLYLVDEYYAPHQERGARYNDPAFGIEWPAEPVVISDKDRHWPDFNPSYHLAEASAEAVR